MDKLLKTHMDLDDKIRLAAARELPNRPPHDTANDDVVITTGELMLASSRKKPHSIGTVTLTQRMRVE